MFSELISDFDGQRVVDFDTGDDWQGPEVAYRLREEYDDDTTNADRLAVLLTQEGAEELTHLIIGAWSKSGEGDDSSVMVQEVVKAARKLPRLRHLFMGEMTYEECEISWINQSDMRPILEAYPQLETLRIRGGNGLSFSETTHLNLKDLGIESGGLSRDTLRELFTCEFPALERLELFLGEPNYGFDGGVEDLQPLLAGKLFPKLKYLGLMNSEIENEIAAVVVNSPIVDRLEILDLSLGNITGEGMRSLHGLAGNKSLKTLNVSHHYGTEKDVTELMRVLPFNVIAEDRQDAEDDEWRPILHAE